MTSDKLIDLATDRRNKQWLANAARAHPDSRRFGTSHAC